MADGCRKGGGADGAPQAVGGRTGRVPGQRLLPEHPEDAGPLPGLENLCNLNRPLTFSNWHLLILILIHLLMI